MDFAQEREQILAGINRRVEELDGLEPDTPHPTCRCERSLNAHLASEIEALESLLELMGNGDPSRFQRYVNEFDGERNGFRVGFAIAQIWRYPSLPEDLRPFRISSLPVVYSSHVTRQLFDPNPPSPANVPQGAERQSPHRWRQ